MSESIETRLASLGIKIPAPGAAAANYIPVVRSGSLLFVSGQTSQSADEEYVGKLGQDFTVEQGQAAARICAIKVLASLKAELGSLDAVERFVKLTGFVNCTPEFTDAHKVINGASDLIVEVFGEAGRHSRSAVGMMSLPLGVAVEVEAIVAG